MKKVMVILVLALGAGVLAIGGWRVATGRGFWGQKSTPVVQETKQPQAKQTQIKPPEAKKPETKKPATEQPQTQSTANSDDSVPQISTDALKNAETDPNIVGLIADYVITRDEVEEQLLRELNPYDYGESAPSSEPITAAEVLIKLVADKAVMMEGRRNGVLETDMIYNAVKKFKDRQLINLLMQKEVSGRLTVTEAEIQEKMKADPKLDREKAEQAVKRAKANATATQYYADLYKKSNVTKATGNFTKASEIHQRLLLRPIVERKVNFIRNHQIKDELSDVEKNMIMATFEGGKVTLKGWFMTIGEIAPPFRPRDLHTAQGVDKLLERTLRTPILVAEAIRQDMDKDEAMRKKVREYEDRNLLGNGRQAKGKEIADPNPDDIKTYFEKNSEHFADQRKLKVDQIWCANLKSAKEARAKLDDGTHFAVIKRDYNQDKESKVTDLYARVEAYFWSDLWKGEPNGVVGPLKGRHGKDFNWRLVRIIEKNQGTIPEFSEKMAERVKRTMLSERRLAIIDKYNKQLLKKYPHKIYADRVKDIDPLDIP